MSSTRTYALLLVNQSTYDDIQTRLQKVDSLRTVRLRGGTKDVIDLDGLAIGIDSADQAPKPSEQLLTVPQAARSIKVSTRTMYEWLRNGKLPVVKFGPRLVRVRKSDLVRLAGESQ